MLRDGDRRLGPSSFWLSSNLSAHSFLRVGSRALGTVGFDSPARLVGRLVEDGVPIPSEQEKCGVVKIEEARRKRIVESIPGGLDGYGVCRWQRCQAGTSRG